MKERETEKFIPNPEFLIKSIAEQGYSLESALADLIDNSLTANANKIEVLTELEHGKLKLFLSDNGDGMSAMDLKQNMRFPSSLMDNQRAANDLGRFGLGMKTASFSQTRCFTVISKKKGSKKYNGRTWDVELLKKGEWRVIINSQEEINEITKLRTHIQSRTIGSIDNFNPNTIIFWNGMYRFDNYLDDQKKEEALNKQLNEVTREYLGIVFHRFMDRNENPLQIKLNNLMVDPFNPFPKEAGIRSLGSEQYALKNDTLSMEGYVLPSASIKSKSRTYRTEHRGLMDLEGMFVYRADRIILFGGWNGVIRKRPNIQLARLKIDLGNASDNLFQLNVAKSRVVIPYDLKKGFLRYILKLAEEARKEYFNRGITDPKDSKIKPLDLLRRVPTSKGNSIKFNNEYPLITELLESLSKEKKHLFKMLLWTIETRINKIRNVHENEDFVSLVESNGLSEQELIEYVNKLMKIGLAESSILKIIEKDLGIYPSSVPDSIKSRIKN